MSLGKRELEADAFCVEGEEGWCLKEIFNCFFPSLLLTLGSLQKAKKVFQPTDFPQLCHFLSRSFKWCVAYCKRTSDILNTTAFFRKWAIFSHRGSFNFSLSPFLFARTAVLGSITCRNHYFGWDDPSFPLANFFCSSSSSLQWCFLLLSKHEFPKVFHSWFLKYNFLHFHQYF